MTADNTRREEAAKAETEAKEAAWRERLVPVEVRLRKLLAEIPLAIQQEGLALSELRKSRRGRWRGNAHVGEVGGALRALGYERRRDWRSEGSLCARWFPKTK